MEKARTKKELIKALSAMGVRLSELEELEAGWKQTEQAVQDAREYADSIVETVRKPLVILGADFRVISANRSFYQAFKVSQEETENRFIYDLGNRQWDIPELRELLEEILSENITFEDFEVEHDFETIGRRVMMLNARRIYMKTSNTMMILLAIEDTTEQKQAEEELRKYQEKMEDLVKERTLDLDKRLKELGCLYEISRIAGEPGSLEKIIQRVVDLIPSSWQYPEIACARVFLEDREFSTENFRETEWKLASDIFLHGNRIGAMEVFYLEERPESDKGPFLSGERSLLDFIAERLGIIIEQKQAEEQIKASIREKEVLLKEVHHRVRNNLQIISSFLNLQSRHIKDDTVIELFRDCQNRIRSMALIHESLYQSRDLASIDFGEYIRNLTNNLCRSFGADPGKILLDIKVKDINMGVDTAIPCGLIVNELVSNAMEYAFPENRRGTIEISLKNDNGKFVFIVRDDGVGIPEGIDIEETETLGLQLVFALVEQLDGNIEFNRQSGTEFKIEFKELRYKNREI
ncbi:MAG: ATP-binding protein [Chloroflexi bacterium]|nr:ATP-binding protein [Chloroflexota bacterium]